MQESCPGTSQRLEGSNVGIFDTEVKTDVLLFGHFLNVLVYLQATNELHNDARNSVPNM